MGFHRKRQFEWRRHMLSLPSFLKWPVLLSLTPYSTFGVWSGCHSNIPALAGAVMIHVLDIEEYRTASLVGVYLMGFYNTSWVMAMSFVSSRTAKLRRATLLQSRWQSHTVWNPVYDALHPSLVFTKPSDRQYHRTSVLSSWPGTALSTRDIRHVNRIRNSDNLWDMLLVSFLHKQIAWMSHEITYCYITELSLYIKIGVVIKHLAQCTAPRLWKEVIILMARIFTFVMRCDLSDPGGSRPSIWFTWESCPRG